MAYLGREAAKAPIVTADIPDDSITSAKIVDATIAAGDLAANSVDSSELVDGSVDLSHMSANSVDSNQYVDGSIDTIHVGDNQITLAKMAGGTDGNIITYDASGDPVAVGPGADGEVLTSTGAGSPPAFEAAASGAPRNYLINGDFQVAQRGTSFTSGSNDDDSYTLDRWYLLSDTDDVVDVTQPPAHPTAPANQLYSIGLDVETVNKKFGIAQIVEQKNCVGLIGGNVTFSFKAKVSATTKLDNVKAGIIAWSSTADAPTSDVVSAWAVEGTNPTLAANLTFENTPANLSITTSWATYSVSANIDTSSTANVIVFIWSDVTDTTAGDFLYITDCQLETGSSASDFARQSYEDELARCQRYFLIWSNDGAFFGTANGSVTTSGNYPLPVVLRTNPVLTTVGGVAWSFRTYQTNESAFRASSTAPTSPGTKKTPGHILNVVPAGFSGLTDGAAQLLRIVSPMNIDAEL